MGNKEEITNLIGRKGSKMTVKSNVKTLALKVYDEQIPDGWEKLKERIKELKKAEADVIAAKKKYDQATANLKELLDKRDAIRKEEILSAVVKSGRSYEEIMNFLNAESDGEKTEK